MALKNFSDLADQAEATWSPHARTVYNAVAASYRAELKARRDLGAKLAATRRARKMTQSQLAQASDVQQADISRIETGRANPTLDTICRINEAIGVRIDLAPTVAVGE